MHVVQGGELEKKPQQATSGMKAPTAKYGCRSCHIGKDQRDDIEDDIVANDRYHHETERIRRQMEGGIREQEATQQKAARQATTGADPATKKPARPARARLLEMPADEVEDQQVSTESGLDKYATG
ncbi:hypothetical protein AC579_5677 [Pseudocercospora musae]|uniref:Uncharacterized protein n=1 Tax=Pseudocercospora musae TaxID=113226 RepID=A0A139HCK0_9PEZI|nr:hypothetical protein AC579_5677 [Pseudocercospora musae]KXT00178.1 hypothetical protein AC579_5677 [Pseudocercospora musae]